MAPAISIIAITRIRREVKQELFWKVKKAMELSSWKENVRQGKIFIKTDLSSPKVVPGMCTSPWVLESVIKVIREEMPYAKIAVGDGGLYSCNNIAKAYKAWGIDRIAKEQKVRLVDLSKEKLVKAADPLDKTGKSKKVFMVPACIFEADSVINVPVVRKDAISGVSSSLKNVLSCLPGQKNLKGSIGRKICAANLIIKSDFIVADATVCMCDDGTLNGVPSVKDTIIAGNDAVSVDSAACMILGAEPERIKYIGICERAGVGSIHFVRKGATIPKEVYFIAGKGQKKRYAASVLPAWIMSKYNLLYNALVWYRLHGRHYAYKVVRKHPLYEGEFSGLVGIKRKT